MAVRIKNTEDIRALREGGRHHAEIMEAILPLVKPGVSTIALHDAGMNLISEKGDIPSFLNFKAKGANIPYPAGICISVNEVIVHGIPQSPEIILKEGDIVTIDIGIKHKDRFTDCAITVPVGAIDAQSAKLLSATKEALFAGIKAARGGNRIGDIGAAVERVARANKLAIIEELCGHGVGFAVHEDPFVPNTGNAGEGELLREGMVLAIEPIFTLGSPRIKLLSDEYTYITADGARTAHFEHTILITKGAPEILTDFKYPA